MTSRLLSDPEIRNLLLVLFVCIVVAVVCLLDTSRTPCLKEMMLCDYYNVSADGKTQFHKGCTVVCNMSDAEIRAYSSGAYTSRAI